MKTNFLSSKKLAMYSIAGLGALLLASCGSSKNSSYYDNDGIYGGKTKTAEANTNSSDSKYYKEYFSSLNKENEEVFTNVETYSTQNDSVYNGGQTENYNAWGANPSTTTVIVYGGNNWGWNNWYGPSWGWGWNNWYGPSYGWGWNSWYGPSWGWGWGYNNYWGWNNPYYGNYWGWNNGYYNNYAYAYGRRDTRTYYNTANRYNTMGSNRMSGARQATVTPTRYNTASRSVAAPSRGNATAPSRNYDTGRPANTAPSRNYNAAPSRDYNNSGSVNSNTRPTRGNTPAQTQTAPTRAYTPNSQAEQPTRTYTPAPTRSSETRSYSPSPSSGGGNYGGGGGGSRGGGGGGGRR